MNAILAVAAKEIRRGLRNRWVAAATLLLAALALGLVGLGSAPTGTVGVDTLLVTVVSLASLSIFIIPLIALLLSYDSLVGEIERGTLLLVLTYPIARWQVLLGKFLGHVAIIALSTLLGYGLAGLVVAFVADHAEAWGVFAALLGSSVLLGAVFIAIGHLISSAVSASATAAGIAIAVWMVLVVLWDLALLGVLVADDQRQLSPQLFPYLLLANPTDVYRLFNLAGFAEVRELSGMAAVAASERLAPGMLLGALVAWMLVPLAAAGALFARREL